MRINRRRVSHNEIRRRYQKRISELEREHAILQEKYRKLQFNYDLLLNFHYFSMESHLEGQDVRNQYRLTD